MFGPFDAEGAPLPYDELPLVVAVRNNRPAHANFEIRSTDGHLHSVEVSAFPILTPTEPTGRSPCSGRSPRTEPGVEMKVKLWGARGSIPSPGPDDDRATAATPPRRGHPLRRFAPRPRRGTGIRNLGLALDAGARPPPHPSHPPPPRPHPGAGLLRPRIPAADRDHHLGPGLAGGLAARADRPLHLGPALPDRGPGAALRRLLPPLPRDRLGDRPGAGSGPHPSPTAGRPSATGSTTATSRWPTSPTTSPPSAPTSTRSRRSGSRASRWRATPRC